MSKFDAVIYVGHNIPIFSHTSSFKVARTCLLLDMSEWPCAGTGAAALGWPYGTDCWIDIGPGGEGWERWCGCMDIAPALKIVAYDGLGQGQNAWTACDVAS